MTGLFDFSAFPRLTTERTVLQEWQPGDASDYRRLGPALTVRSPDRRE